jgi:hypothetical protein
MQYIPSSSELFSEAAPGLDPTTGELPRCVPFTVFDLLPDGFAGLFDSTDGDGECRKEAGVPRSLPGPTFRFFGGGFLTPVGAFRSAEDAFGAGRFFDADGLGVSDGGPAVISCAWSFLGPLSLVPYSFCAAAIALIVSLSRFGASPVSTDMAGSAFRSALSPRWSSS